MSTFAVVDVETTGLNPYRHDRVVEIGIVLVNLGHGIEAEFSTLVDPERDVGPTSIHGLTASDLANAPRFREVAAHVAGVLRPSIALVGHCIAFDALFLRTEFERVGLAMPGYPTIDTRNLAGGGTLGSCCAQYGIEFDGRAHTALCDARAAARLFEQIAISNPALLDPYEPLRALEWPEVPFTAINPVPRAQTYSFSPSPSGHLQRLIDLRSARQSPIVSSGGEQEYLGLLTRALEDRRIEGTEASLLTELANRLGLSSEQVETIHVAYLSELAGAAWADGQVTESELRELQLVCGLLGFGRLSETQFRSLVRHSGMPGSPWSGDPLDSWTGRSVCFTGECQCRFGGVPISRERAEALTLAKGLLVQQSVTRKLDLLVVGDPNTQSTKAKKARQYGIRLIHEPVFWRALGVAID